MLIPSFLIEYPILANSERAQLSGSKDTLKEFLPSVDALFRTSLRYFVTLRERFSQQGVQNGDQNICISKKVFFKE
ncbi:MAG: hypothetical protein H7333_11175 [Bdellovibrionales bacterium]|nr:hypothetical protein [Oligoflexia bacterium]